MRCVPELHSVALKCGCTMLCTYGCNTRICRLLCTHMEAMPLIKPFLVCVINNSVHTQIQTVVTCICRTLFSIKHGFLIRVGVYSWDVVPYTLRKPIPVHPRTYCIPFLKPVGIKTPAYLGHTRPLQGILHVLTSVHNCRTYTGCPFHLESIQC